MMMLRGIPVVYSQRTTSVHTQKISRVLPLNRRICQYNLQSASLFRLNRRMTSFPLDLFNKQRKNKIIALRFLQ